MYIVIPGLQSFLVTVSLSLWCTGGSLQCASAVPGTVIGWGGDSIHICIHWYSIIVGFDHLSNDLIIHYIVDVICMFSEVVIVLDQSTPLGSYQYSTAPNESGQTGQKQQCTGSCDDCYHNRWRE